MVGVSKPFNKSLHAKNDPSSRKLVKKFFAERGVILVDHPNKYDIDLQTEDGKVRVEVERRPVWDSFDFPFDTVNVLERKRKFFETGNTHYCIISQNYKRLGFIPADKLTEYIKPEFLKENPNKYVRKDEYVYKVPVDEFEFYSID